MSQIGTIDCGYLAEIQAFADQEWVDPIKNIDLIANADAAKAVLTNQQVKLGQLKDKNKTKVVEVEWLTSCDLASQACSDDCTITGSDATPECKEYEISCLREVPFQVYDRVYRLRTTEAQQSIAHLKEHSKKILDEYIASLVIAGIGAAAGTNVFTGAPGTVGAAVTTVPAVSWNDSIWGYFARVALGNQFKAPYLISGDNLFQLVYNRLADQANADGKGNVNRMGDFRSRIFFDLFNLEALFPHYTFMVHKTAAAFLNKAWYPEGAANAYQPKADHFLWSEPSRNLPGIMYDVFAQRGCYNNDYYTAMKVQLHGNFALNPKPCSTTNSGILAFACS